MTVPSSQSNVDFDRVQFLIFLGNFFRMSVPMKLLEMTCSVMVVENSYDLGEVGWVDRLLFDFVLFFF